MHANLAVLTLCIKLPGTFPAPQILHILQFVVFVFCDAACVFVSSVDYSNSKTPDHVLVYVFCKSHCHKASNSKDGVIV